MYTFFKFLCVGLLNTSLDFLVLNICIFFFGTGHNGELFVVFKSVSFLTAVTNSYFMNKYWVFQNTRKIEAKEPTMFFIISCIGFLINVSIAFLVFTIFAPPLSPHWAANLGALAGACVVFVWNFIGYRFFVFKPQHD